jgi:hypothetical protein
MATREAVEAVEAVFRTIRDNRQAASPSEAAPIDLNDIELEDVIDVLVERLEWRQKDSASRCREYALAITKLEEAHHWLGARRRRIGNGER